MSRDDAQSLKRGDYLIWQPSGLKVEMLDVNEDGVSVRAPRGGVFTVTFDHLEKVQ